MLSASCCRLQLASICRNAFDARSLMQGLSCQRMIFESADSRLWLMDDLDSSIRLNHGFVAGHFLHPGLLATDHEMRASSSTSSSGMGLETRAGCRVCGVLPIGWTPDQSRHCSNQNHRMLSTSTFHVHQARINGAYGQPSLRLAMQIPTSCFMDAQIWELALWDLVWMQDFQLPP